MSTRRILLLAFFVYVLADLGCPLVPGAFRFDPAESVEAISVHRAWSTPVLRALAPPAQASIAVQTGGRGNVPAPRPRPLLVGWAPHAAPCAIARQRAPDPRPSIEDD